jgi:hypothetical protein
MERISVPDRPTCECGASEGQLHKFHCRWEYCPFCESQFVDDCECAYEHLGLKRRDHPPGNSFLSDEVYNEGLSPELEARWQELCTARGRIPFLYQPLLCARCGCIDPTFFMVQDAAWEYYAGPTFRGDILCEPCFRAIKDSIDATRERPTWVPGDTEIFEHIAAFHRGDREALRRLQPEKFTRGS